MRKDKLGERKLGTRRVEFCSSDDERSGAKRTSIIYSHLSHLFSNLVHPVFSVCLLPRLLLNYTHTSSLSPTNNACNNTTLILPGWECNDLFSYISSTKIWKHYCTQSSAFSMVLFKDFLHTYTLDRLSREDPNESLVTYKCGGASRSEENRRIRVSSMW